MISPLTLLPPKKDSKRKLKKNKIKNKISNILGITPGFFFMLIFSRYKGGIWHLSVHEDRVVQKRTHSMNWRNENAMVCGKRGDKGRKTPVEKQTKKTEKLCIFVTFFFPKQFVCFHSQLSYFFFVLYWKISTSFLLKKVLANIKQKKADWVSKKKNKMKKPNQVLKVKCFYKIFWAIHLFCLGTLFFSAFSQS